MKVTVQDARLNFVKKIVDEVISTFINSLNNKALLKAKVLDLEVKIFNTKNETTFGMMSTNGEEHVIGIYVCPLDSDKKIAFIIAHEFAHLLFVNVIDSLSIFGEASDNSTMRTAIKRVDKKGNVYGHAMEEMVADYLALFIVNKLNLSDDNGTFEKTMEEKSTIINFVEEFSSFFGDVLKEKIDETRKVFFDADEYFEPCNLFWYSVVTFNYSLTINMYDNFMGMYAFGDMNEKLDKCLKSSSKNHVERNEVFKSIIADFQTEIDELEKEF